MIKAVIKRPVFNYEIKDMIQIPRSEYEYLKARSDKLDLITQTVLTGFRDVEKRMKEVSA